VNNSVRDINKYAVMYDQLKAIYGEDLDRMINVIHESGARACTNVSSDQAIKEALSNNIKTDEARNLLLLALSLGGVSALAFGYLAITHVRRVIELWKTNSIK
jgi:hypothetical protein